MNMQHVKAKMWPQMMRESLDFFSRKIFESDVAFTSCFFAVGFGFVCVMITVNAWHSPGVLNVR